ncbi:Gfo/Idh/MocA family oxidoreductase [bacterium]|nr:Gfo/Idh/MocA family oxidoreductase [bacterium]
MSNKVRVAIIGLDTTHSLAFSGSMNDPECPDERKIVGMKAVSCLRFSTPFQSEEGLNERQQQLESWGVPVTLDFDEAVADCDAIMLEINDPAYHLEYFNRAAELGKPMFLDKPLADTIENGRKIHDLAVYKKLKVFSASSLRFVSELQDAAGQIPEPKMVWTYGPLGEAPAGSSIIWYGVHAFEMLQRAIGSGAVSVQSANTSTGVVCTVDYDDGRRGVVELTKGYWTYGGCLRDKEHAVSYTVDMSKSYTSLLQKVQAFFNGTEQPATMDDALEIMALLDAAEKSSQSNKPEKVVRG